MAGTATKAAVTLSHSLLLTRRGIHQCLPCFLGLGEEGHRKDLPANNFFEPSSANPSFPILKKWAMLRAMIVFQSAVSAEAGAPIHHRRRRRPFQLCIEAAAVLFGGPPHA